MCIIIKQTDLSLFLALGVCVVMKQTDLSLFLNHSTVGSGFPSALHLRLTVVPSSIADLDLGCFS